MCSVQGTGFPLPERDRLGLRGLVPPRVMDVDAQARKVYEDFQKRPTPLDKWLYLQALQDRNETLFYKVIIDHVEETAPIIYTPTVGEVCLQYSRLYRRARGMFFSVEDVGNMHAMCYNWPSDRVDVIVVTDGSRILGLGDLGVQGMGIPIGKLDLYVAGAGLHPSYVLPICLDVGTDNETLRNDPWYLGVPRPRLQGDAYIQAVDELVAALHSRWPNALLQFEDFSTDHALTLLERYRDGPLACFNDDIQGTASVVLGGVYGALAAQGMPNSAITQQKFLVCGAGSAGMGIASALCSAMQKHGLSREEALRQFCVMDIGGVIGQSRAHVDRAALPFASRDVPDGLHLEEAIEAFKPTALLGLSTVKGLFSEKALRMMSQLNARPLILPLSNPTSRSECTCEQAAVASEGRAIFACGSPFPDHVMPDGTVVRANQGNNFFVFPGVGLGAALCGAARVTDGMLIAAAEALPTLLTAADHAAARIYPRVSDIRRVSTAVACAVIRAAAAEGVVRNSEARRMLETGMDDTLLQRWIVSKMYTPAYVPLVQSHK
jgi:malate dehydrogenase (decarboxylating)